MMKKFNMVQISLDKAPVILCDACLGRHAHIFAQELKTEVVTWQEACEDCATPVSDSYRMHGPKQGR